MNESGKQQGLKYSPLTLNLGLGLLEQWNEDAIKARADKLAHIAVKVWKSPSLTSEIMAAYKPMKTAIAGYTINDHPRLLGNMRELFEALRKEITALDPRVTEVFLRNYVAYKVETNFVDVTAQANGLRLALNMKFPEINDPRCFCKDVSAVGHWGNGDVEVGLASLNELAYVMGLVRQSFERQMDSDSDA